MKYLILNGSPRKGNTWKLTELAKEQLQTLDGKAEFSEIHMNNQKLPFCCGCSSCFRTGHETCPHSAIILPIISAMEEADGIIVSSTSYAMRETSLLKNLFDHLCFMLHRPHFFQKKALILTTAGGIGAKQAAKSIAAFLSGIGFNRCYQFGVATYSWNDYQVNEKTRLALEKSTKKFYRDLASRKLHSPTVPLLIPYNIFRGMSLCYVKGTEYATLDGDYWTEEARIKGVYDRSVPVPFYKRPVGHLFYLIGKYAGKSVVVSYKK